MATGIKTQSDREAIALIAAELLKQMCATDAALERTPHSLVKHAFDVATAFADECIRQDEADK